MHEFSVPVCMVDELLKQKITIKLENVWVTTRRSLLLIKKKNNNLFITMKLLRRVIVMILRNINPSKKEKPSEFN